MSGGLQKKKRRGTPTSKAPMKAPSRPGVGVTRTSGAKPVDAKTVPETPSTSGRVLKYRL